MTNAQSFTKRASVAGVTALAIVVGGIGLTANAAVPAFAPYDEDNPDPYQISEGLVFYKNADMGWIVNAPIESVESLAYTVADSTSWAPSFQLVTFSETNVTATNPSGYGRLVWEPAEQRDASIDPNSGEYTDLQAGKWWTNKIDNDLPGGISHPQPLSFFTDSVADGGAGWTNVNVYAIDLHQGSTTESTSVVTKLVYNDIEVPLGNADTTPYDEADIDLAKAPLNTEITNLTSQVNELTTENGALGEQVTALKGQLEDAKLQVTIAQGQVETAQGQVKTAQAQLLTAQGLLATAQGQVGADQGVIGGLLAQVADLQTQVDDLKVQVKGLKDDLKAAQDHAADLQILLAAANQALTDADAAHGTVTAGLNAQITGLNTQITDLTAWKNSHHTADGTNLGVSVAVLTATPVHNKTVGVRLVGSIASASGLKYQWYVGNKAVAGATGATFKVPSTATGKTVFVLVTGTTKFMVYSIESNYGVAK